MAETDAGGMENHHTAEARTEAQGEPRGLPEYLADKDAELVALWARLADSEEEVERQYHEAQQAEAEVARLKRQEGGQTKAAQSAWRAADVLRAERDEARAQVARVRALAAEAKEKGTSLQAVEELRLVGNAYVGMSERITAALDQERK